MNAYDGQLDQGKGNTEEEAWTFHRRATSPSPSVASLSSQQRGRRSPSGSLERRRSMSSERSERRSRSRSPIQFRHNFVEDEAEEEEVKEEEEEKKRPREQKRGARRRPLHNQPERNHSNEEIKAQESVIQPASLFEGDYGPEDPELDSWCFMRDTNSVEENPEDPNDYRAHLRKLAAQYGTDDTFRIVRRCKHFYDTRVPPTARVRPWTLRSIRNWVETQASDEGIGRFIRLVSHRNLIAMCDSEVMQLINGKRTWNSSSTSKLNTCLRSLKSSLSSKKGP
jgi:hypothetical protein